MEALTALALLLLVILTGIDRSSSCRKCISTLKPIILSGFQVIPTAFRNDFPTEIKESTRQSQLPRSTSISSTGRSVLSIPSCLCSLPAKAKDSILCIHKDLFEIKNDDVKAFMLSSIQFYKKWISPILPPSCRYLPTCSSYGMEAIEKFGPWKGGILTVWRIIRCNPFGGRGYDPPRWPPALWFDSEYTYTYTCICVCWLWWRITMAYE